MWNKLMDEMQCCGVNDYTDFSKSKSWMENKGENVVPPNCCHKHFTNGIITLDDESCPRSPNEKNSYYKEVKSKIKYYYISSQ